MGGDVHYRPRPRERRRLINLKSTGAGDKERNTVFSRFSLLSHFIFMSTAHWHVTGQKAEAQKR